MLDSVMFVCLQALLTIHYLVHKSAFSIEANAFKRGLKRCREYVDILSQVKK